jgi:hypothetical protein
VLSNVAVDPEYRGRGIATALVHACLDHARRDATTYGSGTPTVLLQVWAANEPARRLYEKEGFRPLSSVGRLVLEPDGASPSLPVPCPEGWHWRDSDGNDAYLLSSAAAAMLPYEAQAVRTVSTSAFYMGTGEWLRRAARAVSRQGQRGDARARQRVLLKDKAVRGGLALKRGGSVWRLVAILPQPPDQPIAECLAAEAVELARQAGDHPVICDVPDHLQDYSRALQAAGFRLSDSLVQMSLALS